MCEVIDISMRIGVLCDSLITAESIIKGNIIVWDKVCLKSGLPITSIDEHGNLYTFLSYSSTSRGYKFDQLMFVENPIKHYTEIIDDIRHTLVNSCVPNEYQIIIFNTDWIGE